MRSRQGVQNWLYCALVGVLGLYASAYQTLVGQLTERFGLDERLMGVLLAVYAAGSLCSVLVSGMLSDSLGKRRVVLCAAPVMCLGLVCAATAGAVALLFAGLFLAGHGFGPCESTGSALLTDENPGASTRWMNISQIFFGLGAIVAPLAATWYLSRAGASTSGALLICAGAVFVCWLLLAFTSGGRLGRPAVATRDLNPFTVLKSREFLLYGVLVFLYLCYESVAPAYFKQLFLKRGADEGTANLAISVFWTAIVACRLVGAFMEGKEKKCIVVFSPLVAVGALLALLARGDGLRLLGVALYGVGLRPGMAHAVCAGGAGVPAAQRRFLCGNDVLFHGRQLAVPGDHWRGREQRGNDFCHLRRAGAGGGCGGGYAARRYVAGAAHSM